MNGYFNKNVSIKIYNLAALNKLILWLLTIQLQIKKS